jgi:hypothetical protein
MPAKIPTAGKERPPGGLHNSGLGSRNRPLLTQPPGRLAQIIEPRRRRLPAKWRSIGEILAEKVERIARARA